MSASRRGVEKRSNRTIVTRKSAQARISALPQASTPQALNVSPLDVDPSAQLAGSRQQLLSDQGRTPRHPQPTIRGRRPVSSENHHLDLEDDDDDDDDDDDYSSFILGLKKKEVLQLANNPATTDPWGRTTPDRAESPSPSPDPKSPHGLQATTYRVLRSSYEGDLFRNSKLKAQLYVGPNKRPGQVEFKKPLFRWIHVENPNMHFGAFMEYVSRCPYLHVSERDSLGSILRTAREKSDRSLRRPTAGMTGSYIEPEYLEETIESTAYLGPRAKTTKKDTVKWIAIPYFYLTSKEGEKTARENNKGCVSEGDYFQVAQFWCLILGDSFMISCARVSVAEIPGNLIRLNSVPPHDPERPLTGPWMPTLQVSDGGLRLWLIPLDECQTWAAFAANFVGLGFSVVDGWHVKYRDIILSASDWPAVVSMAKKTSVTLKIIKKDEKKDKDKDEDDVPMDLGLESDEDTEKRKQDDAPVLRVDEFHVFTLLATEPTPQSSEDNTAIDTVAYPKVQYKINEDQLEFDLAQLDDYLLNANVRYKENVHYASCPRKSSHDMETSLLKLQEADQGDFSCKKLFARGASEVFQLFFPLPYEHPITLRFWGSIDRIIQIKDVTSTDQFKLLAHKVNMLAKIAKEVRLEIFAEKHISEYMTTIPDEFIQAWILIQMTLVCFPNAPTSRFLHHLSRCKELMLQARLTILQRLQPVDIREREAVTPTGVTMLLLGQLLHDSQGPLTPERHRLTSAYWTYLKDLKQDVHNSPLNRKYEGTITVLKSEFETVVGTLEDQRRVLIALEDSINEAESQSFVGDAGPSMRIDVEPTREASVTDYLVHQTEEMLQNFWEMSRRLTDLETWHYLCLSADSDMQNKATFAFTTVTVFFLPLTTLTGIMGMNTSDIRDMAEGQWLFWAVGTPMAIVCLLIWAIYLGSFERMWGSTKKKGLMKR